MFHVFFSHRFFKREYKAHCLPDDSFARFPEMARRTAGSGRNFHASAVNGPLTHEARSFLHEVTLCYPSKKDMLHVHEKEQSLAVPDTYPAEEFAGFDDFGEFPEWRPGDVAEAGVELKPAA